MDNENFDLLDSDDFDEYEEEEYFFDCPHCFREVSVMLELTPGRQVYYDDCPECDEALQIRYEVEEDMIVEFTVKAIE